MNIDNLKDHVASQVDTAEELVTILEISVEDVLSRFADKLLEHQEKFGIQSDE